MKIFVQFFTTVLIGFLFSAMCYAAPHSLDTPHSKKSGHIMGNNFRAFTFPLLPFITRIKHIYPVAHGNDGRRYAWYSLGSVDSGGVLLPDTTTKCDKNCIDISTVNYVMTNKSCTWPVIPFYGVVGVCWNLTNRALYYMGKTVHNVEFYPIIEDYFGTYGLDDNSTCISPLCMIGRVKYSWSSCKRATQANFPWQGKKLNLLTGKKGVDPRITLYNKYYSKNKVAALQGISPKELRERYLASLMDLNIDEHLAANFPADRRAVLQEIRLNLEDRLKGLKVSAATHKDYLVEFNLAVNQSLDEYRAVLSEKEYEQFMNASKKEVYDVRINNK